MYKNRAIELKALSCDWLFRVVKVKGLKLYVHELLEKINESDDIEFFNLPVIQTIVVQLH